MHHGREDEVREGMSDEVSKSLRMLMDEHVKKIEDAEKLGATGQFPEGKLSQDDEGKSRSQ